VATPDAPPRPRSGRWLPRLRRREAPARPGSSRGSIKRSPSPVHTFKGKPKNMLEVFVWVIDDPKRTRRTGLLVGTLIAVTAGCLAGVVYVIQLHPDRWALVVAASASVIAIAERVRRIKVAGRLEVLMSENDEEPDPGPGGAATAARGRPRRQRPQ
jgi:hypothetical protein